MEFIEIVTDYQVLHESFFDNVNWSFIFWNVKIRFSWIILFQSTAELLHI